MGRLFGKLKDFFDGKEDEDSGEETTDVDATGLSHVGAAAYEVLRTVHEDMHHVTWDVTSGKVVGELDQTPKGICDMEEEPPEGHSDWLPEKMAAIMERTEHWCDVMVSTDYGVRAVPAKKGVGEDQPMMFSWFHSPFF